MGRLAALAEIARVREDSWKEKCLDTAECSQFQGTGGSRKACLHYLDSGSCNLPSQFMCVKLLQLQGRLPGRDASQASGASPEADNNPPAPQAARKAPQPGPEARRAPQGGPAPLAGAKAGSQAGSQAGMGELPHTSEVRTMSQQECADELFRIASRVGFERQAKALLWLGRRLLTADSRDVLLDLLTEQVRPKDL